MTAALAIATLLLLLAFVVWTISVHTPDDNRVNPDTLQRLRDGRLR